MFYRYWIITVDVHTEQVKRRNSPNRTKNKQLNAIVPHTFVYF